MSEQEKPFGGQIKYWAKRPISDAEKQALKEEYGEDDGLGYVVTGRIQRFGILLTSMSKART